MLIVSNHESTPERAAVNPWLPALTASGVPRGRRAALALLALAVAAAIWLPLVHVAFAVPAPAFTAPEGVPPMARALAARHLALWERPALREREIGKMRVRNAEWDFMGRTFLVLALAYILAWFAFVLGVPILVLGAGILAAALKRWAPAERQDQDRADARGSPDRSIPFA
jgi:hypothetical protein